MGSNPQIARVKGAPYADGDALLANLVFYDHEGNAIGRLSEPFDGPTDFEPACDLAGWTPIYKPAFPLPRCGYSNELRRKNQ